MKSSYLATCILLCLSTLNLYSQSATIKGVILDVNHNPVPEVLISSSSTATASDAYGFYELLLPAEKQLTITFSHLSFEKVSLQLQLQNAESFEFHPILKENIAQIGEIVLRNNQKNIFGIQHIDARQVREIPGANPGVENLLKTLPGVNSNNELSTQYSVRGGNYDENLVYVNEIEIYRPFLIRSGQQEGMSFINSDLIQNIEFSAGGFQAKYGDKLSSVLDITYRTPTEFTAGVDLSLLGASAYVGTASEDQRFTSISGIRYHNNSLLVDSKETKTNYQPDYADAQSLISYRFSGKFQLQFLGSLSQNRYSYRPKTRITKTGTLSEPIGLRINYSGSELDRYKTALGALKANYQISQHTNLKFITSLYSTNEKESYNIQSNYQLGIPNTENAMLVDDYIPIGSQTEFADNQLKATILNLHHKGIYKKNGNSLEWGLKYTLESFKDQFEESLRIDSIAVDSIQNSTPWQSYPQYHIQAQHSTKIHRVTSYAQWSKHSRLGPHELWLSAGLRAQYWSVASKDIPDASHFIWSPRMQLALKPNWQSDMVFRLAAGVYQQPPFYKEMRDSIGRLHPEVNAQKSYHFVLGHDFSFKLWNRPFKLISEAYYKHLKDVNPYTIHNVRIQYQAKNNTTAYAYGMDLRLNGEFVPGTQSWLSIGYLKTEENQNHRGDIPRPTDQRLSFGLLFQDYMASVPDLQLYIKAIYNTGLPGGSPRHIDSYTYQSRLPDYKRMDVGLSYSLFKSKGNVKKSKSRNYLKEIKVGLEIFNIFDIQNTITNTWINDYYTNTHYAISNHMTGRIFNIKAGLRF